MPLNYIKVPHNKGTEKSETINIPLPEKVVIPLLQHMGAPCQPLVAVGDKVCVGEKIGDTDAFMSTPVHASVSGVVEKIIDYLPVNGKPCKAIVVKSDNLQTVSPQVKPPNVTDTKSFIKAVRESGCCGLGGAGFPTHVKLTFDKEKTPVNTLIINAAECEPYITSDYREMIEKSEDIYNGIKLVQKYLDIPKALICIEDNKPKAIKLLTKLSESDNGVSVKKLPSSYPQGAEKVITYVATKKVVKEGELPLHQGVLVVNVSTIGFVGRYINTGMPLVSKRVTIDGDAILTPCNANVPIGTPVSKVLDFADCNKEIVDKLIAGGPMMGICLYDFETPVCKTNNAFLGFKKSKTETVQTNCIRCSRCISACPMQLMPTSIEKAYDQQDMEWLKKLRVNLCMNCGCCSYVCPAKRHLAEKNQLAKGLLAQAKS